MFIAVPGVAGGVRHPGSMPNRSMSVRRLIINADDFGLSAGINRGVAEAHERGVVTSASLMVCWPDASPAAAHARRWADFSIGLHLDLGEWTYRDGSWRSCYERVAMDDLDAVAFEIDAQLNRFHTLVGRDPTHLDSHQHVHLREPLRQLMLERGDRLGIPIRGLTGEARYCGSFYGLGRDGEPNPGAISLDGFMAAADVPEAALIEVGCHPAAEVDFESMYGLERVRELHVLCDPRLRAALDVAGLELASFHDLD
jgi:chitin disaccharide deacetylase